MMDIQIINLLLYNLLYLCIYHVLCVFLGILPYVLTITLFGTYVFMKVIFSVNCTFTFYNFFVFQYFAPWIPCWLTFISSLCILLVCICLISLCSTINFQPSSVSLLQSCLMQTVSIWILFLFLTFVRKIHNLLW